MSRTLRAVAACLIGLALSACQINVLYLTRLDDAGGGSFSLGVALDREALAASPRVYPEGLAEIEGLFGELRAQGWTVERTALGGGLALVATRRFADGAGFERALAELRGTRPAPDPRFGAPQVRLDFTTRRSFFKTRAEFHGVFDTATEDPRLRDWLRVARDSLRFEVRAEMPGSPAVRDAGGTVEGGAVVWRPQLGTLTSFAADSSALRTGSVLLLVVPALLLLAGGAWFLLGRRRAPAVRLAILPEPAQAAEENQTIVLEPEPVEQLLAIERDPAES